jgi:hypothetical protein
MRYVIFYLMIAFQILTKADILDSVSYEAEYIAFMITMAYLGWCYDRK